MTISRFLCEILFSILLSAEKFHTSRYSPSYLSATWLNKKFHTSRYSPSYLSNTGSPPDTASFLSWSPQIRTATSVVISSSWGCHLQFVSHCSSQGALPFHGSHCILPDFLLQVHLVFLYAEKWRRPGSSHPCTRWHFSIKRLLLLVSLTKPFLNQNFSCFLCMLTRSLLFKMTRSWYLLINEIRESHFIKLAHASKCALHTPA
ncbi:uncharacterized protein LOC120524071 isoform X3 [Polypterus senegalus]|uniref:uncharacterized protein LOC120524071 isoform X3 n=1 Tax=Polypterus senegalus TaxID=55291 RepID=UPI00196636D7|nr:uncharacterized protein LOC120524071 isoform X3 [Polypterus senegalus]